MTINLKAGIKQPIQEESQIAAFGLVVDLDASYVYMGNENVSETNYWKKIPGGGHVNSGETDLSQVYLLSPDDAIVEVTIVV